MTANPAANNDPQVLGEDALLLRGTRLDTAHVLTGRLLRVLGFGFLHLVKQFRERHKSEGKP
jgi:hypothetical protein